MIYWMVRGPPFVPRLPIDDPEGVVEVVAESSENITDPATFDTYRSLLKHHSHLKGSVMNKMLDSISSGLATQVDAAMHDIESEDQQTAMSHRLPLEMYCFLLQWFVSIANEGKPTEGEDPISAPPPARGRRGRGGRAGAGKATGGRGQSKKAVDQWSWADQIPAILALVSRALRLKTKRVWTSTSDLDAFVTYAPLNISLSMYLTRVQMRHTTSLPCHGV
jgi:condensin complex subunit 1